MDIKEQLKRDEGVRTTPYVDTAGKTSIGVGRNLTDVGIFIDEVDYLLQNDINRTTASLQLRLPYYAALDDARQGVLTNMAFNMGVAGLEGFPKMLAAVATGDWNTASIEMLNSAWARQVGDRAVRLAEQMRTGIWQ